MAAAVVAALVLTAAVDVWSIAAELHRASLMAPLDANPGSVSLTTIRTADHQVQAAAISGGVLLLVTGILFIVWLHRVVRQLHAVRPGVMRYSPGWSIGAWFVPFLNLVRPKQIVDDCWKATAAPEELHTGVPATFHFWWATWLIANFLTWLGIRYPSDTASQFATGDRIGAVADGIDLVAAALAITVVLALARRVAALPPPAVYVSNYEFNPPPGWPAPPAGGAPPLGWQPDPAWPAAPEGWAFWLPRET